MTSAEVTLYENKYGGYVH